VLALKSNRWRDLEGCFGSGEVIPDLLRRLDKKYSKQNRLKLWDHLFHQYSVYTAAFAAVPHLVRMLPNVDERANVDLLIDIGSIATFANERELKSVEADIRDGYQASLIEARGVAVNLFGMVPLSEDELVYLLMGIPGLSGYNSLGIVLESLSDKEFSCSCPDCSKRVFVSEKENALFSAVEEPYLNPDMEMLPVRPYEGEEAQWNGRFARENAVQWLSHLAQKAGEHELAKLLLNLFGVAACPHCGFEFCLVDRLEQEVG